MPPIKQKRLCIVVHDVAPATWANCSRLLALIDALGAPPLTLLVVPDYHDLGAFENAPDFTRAIDRRIARGDEVALHGYAHLDASPPARGLRDRFRRRVMTAGEGEFAAISRSDAADKIARGRAMFDRVGWRADGFVPPAWLANDEALAALSDTEFRYTSTHGAIVALPKQRRYFAPCLTASTRSAWRRAASRAWLRVAARLFHSARVLRVGLHPADAQHADVMATWRDVLAHLLTYREPITKRRALAELECAAPASC